ncbi:GerAB/ArcD/ProY family transporter [Ectobacillus funiculus]
MAILLGTGAGVCLFLVYDYLYHQYEGLPLTQYVRSILGKYLGSLLALLYIFYFFYLSARVLRDFGDLLLTSTLEATPMLVINSLLMLVIGGAVYYGLEVVGRTGEIILPFMTFLALITGIAILFSHIFHIENLLPVLEGGWKPVMKATFPLTVTFPFGEIIVFSMILPYVNEQAYTRKRG